MGKAIQLQCPVCGNENYEQVPSQVACLIWDYATYRFRAKCCGCGHTWNVRTKRASIHRDIRLLFG